jgi:hypothetical protein
MNGEVCSSASGETIYNYVVQKVGDHHRDVKTQLWRRKRVWTKEKKSL